MNKLLEAHERGEYAKPLGTIPAVVGRSANLPAETGIADPFLAFAATESGTDILGSLLRFSKGDWLANRTEIPSGTEFVAAVDALVVGWVRWEGKSQVERRLGRVSDGFQEPSREELGHTDESRWEVDSDGQPTDPWQKTRYLPLKRVEDGELFTLTLPGRGRAGEAIGRLVGAYGRSRNRTDGYPIVRLGVDSYEHRQYGRIKYPMLTIVGWRPRAEFAELETGDAGFAMAQGGGYATDLPERIDKDEDIPF